jgi:signal transduction histidine kinase
VRAAVMQAFDPLGDGSFSAEYRIFLPNGRLRWLLVTGKTTFQGSGSHRKACRLIGTVQDVTRRHRNEEALREADQRKNNFLAVLAHELRGPLSTTLNSVEILRIDHSEATIAEATDLIERQVQHMAQLVEELLEVSRIARGKIRLQRTRCDLTSLVQQSALDYRSTLLASGLTLNLQLPEEPLWVLGDSMRLAQVVSNLLQNARKFTDVGGQIDIRLEADRRRHRATLTVRDTGIGMTQETVARLFTPFSQAEGSAQRNHSGLGLGLSLVKGLIDLHGGTVRAASEGLGFGAELTVELPLENAGESD